MLNTLPRIWKLSLIINLKEGIDDITSRGFGWKMTLAYIKILWLAKKYNVNTHIMKYNDLVMCYILIFFLETPQTYHKTRSLGIS
jgi:adenine specific DNA methylase Mod